MPLQGAIVVCYRGEGRVTANFGGVDVVPLQGAVLVWYGWWGAFFLYIENTHKNWFLLFGVYAGIYSYLLLVIFCIFTALMNFCTKFQ